MGKCDNCRLRKESAKAFDIHWMGADDCPYNKCPVPDFPKTNADRLRAMTDEELAELWWERVDCGECPVHKECKLTGQDCKRLALDWLKQEAEDAD